MVTAMMKDASDGVMDGMMGSTSISMVGMGGMTGGMMPSTAGTAGLSTAMGTFIGSAMNRSGVPMADMQALMNQLAWLEWAAPRRWRRSHPDTAACPAPPSWARMSVAGTAEYGEQAGRWGHSSVRPPSIAPATSPSRSAPTVERVMLQLAGGSFTDEATGTP